MQISINNAIAMQNLETIEAILEAERLLIDPKAKTYTMDKALAELNK